MRFKPVPEPPADLEAVASILAAVPETAGAVDDCCARLVEDTRLEDRSAAETWLVFLRALELATEEPAGYRRATAEPPSAACLESASADRRLREAFRERVDGAAAVLEVLERADGPRSADDVAAEYRTARRGRFEGDATERVRRLLEWAVLLGAAERADEGYRPTGSNPTDE